MRSTMIRSASFFSPAMTLGSSRLEEDNDPELIRRVAGKDRRAFETLYERYARRIYRYLARLISQPDVIEEVVDDVMLVVWENASRFNHTSKVSTWIFGIAHFKALKARARLSGRATEQPVSDEHAGHADSPEDLSTRRDLGRLVARGLATLSPEQRAVVELTFYDGCSYQEIADITRSPVNTVKTRMFSARRRLAPLLSTLGLGPRPGSQEAS